MPNNGMSEINCHHPDLLISCNLLVQKFMDGIVMTRPYNSPTNGMQHITKLSKVTFQ
ncbi:MAG: hypothetical protein MJ250_07700 [Alphaproteobacteria bacterium]|nr:hypothetical protein [Alphaproteobacteria bacterium]